MPSIVWKGHLTFGLVSIPVKLYRAARRERVRMHYVHRPEVLEEAVHDREVNPSEAPVRFAERAPQRLQDFPPGPAAHRERARATAAIHPYPPGAHAPLDA